MNEPENDQSGQRPVDPTDYDPNTDPEAQPSPIEAALRRSHLPPPVQINDQSNDQTPGVSLGKSGEIVSTKHRPPARDINEEDETQEQRWARTLSKPWHLRYVIALSQLGVAGLACRQAGVSRATVSRARAESPEFAAACQEAETDKVEAVEASLFVSATVGDPEPIFQGGRRVGTRRRKSDKAAEIILRAERPEKYRPDYQGAPTQQTIILQTAEQIAETVRGLSPALAPKTIEARIVPQEPEKT